MDLHMVKEIYYHISFFFVYHMSQPESWQHQGAAQRRSREYSTSCSIPSVSCIKDLGPTYMSQFHTWENNVIWSVVNGKEQMCILYSNSKEQTEITIEKGYLLLWPASFFYQKSLIHRMIFCVSCSVTVTQAICL